MWSKEEIGKVIKESRLSAGLTQMQVAEALGRPQNTISAWEMGRAQPDANTLFELFQVLGRSVDEAFGFTKQPFEVTKYEVEYIKKYRALDWHGKEIVDVVLKKETDRICMEEKAQAHISASQAQQTNGGGSVHEITIFAVPYQVLPASAGTGQESEQEYPEDLRLIKQPPSGTSFVVRVSGNSMEPTYYDGDLVFVHATVEIRPGQIGVFYMDGQQWIKELGDGDLISHNKAYKPCKIVPDIRCQGLVLGVCDDSYFE